MISSDRFFNKDEQQKIKDAAVLEEVIRDEVALKISGKKGKADCPFCSGNKKLNIDIEKDIYKCFTCGEGGKGAVNFYMKVHREEYQPALRKLADRFNVILEEPKTKKKTSKKKKVQNRKRSFRDTQLRESGMPVKAQKYELHQSADTYLEIDRYEKGTINKSDWSVINGDDMLLHYVDLTGRLMQFEQKGKMRPYIRIRYQNPHLHLNSQGKPMKYGSPYGSKAKIWFPNLILKAFKTKLVIETLYIIEGEKKADAMCLLGLHAVAISGIHNFSNAGDMPHQFEMLIKACGVKNIVFVQDADWQEIKVTDPMKSVDSRPHLFYLSASRFREYFKNYYYSGIELDIFFAYGKDPIYKGIDDLIVNGLKEKKDELKEDFENARIDRQGKGKHVDVLNITNYSEHKLKSLWNLESPQKFFATHEKELKEFREFKFRKLRYRWNKEEATFELAQKIMPHEEFWHETINEKTGKSKFSFNYVGILEFLKNRGYGLYKIDRDNFIHVHVENKIIRQVHPNEIKRYVMDFVRQMTSWNKNSILEMLLRGGDQYLGTAKLSQMFFVDPSFNRATKETMYLYFKTKYWEITKDSITEHQIADLPRHIWQDKIIDFEPELFEKPYIRIKRDGECWKTQQAPNFHDCDIADFYFKTSFFHWRKMQELTTDQDGNQVWTDREKPEQIQKHDVDLLKANLIAKMCSTGYLLHDFTDYGNMKAIIAMDGLESEVGRSQGGTGKGIYCSTFENMVPVHWVDGKRKNLDDDKHIFGGVDERTQVIYFEDIRVNFDFERLFPTITKGTWVEKKGIDGHREDPKKVLIDTNHALNGNGNSHARRKFHISFSDYYNEHRSVRQDFGHNFYTEWDYKQWNAFYNFMANCMQTYLKFGLTYSIPTKTLERRRLRQNVGEDFLEWANLLFHTTEDVDGKRGKLLNHRLYKSWLFEEFQNSASGWVKRNVSEKKFKEKMKKYAAYAGLKWNITREDKEDDRIISSGREYFLLSDEHFNINTMQTVSRTEDMNTLNVPETTKIKPEELPEVKSIDVKLGVLAQEMKDAQGAPAKERTFIRKYLQTKIEELNKSRNAVIAEAEGMPF